MKHFLSASLLICLSLLVGAQARGEPSPSPSQRFQQAILFEQWDQAEALLPVLQADPSVDPVQVLFSIGMMAGARGQYDLAIEAFRQILADHPALTRVRLELARAYFLKGDYELAQLHFERVLGGNVPEAVAANIRRYLGAIRQDRSWTFNMSLGYLSDTNANSGTSVDTVNFFGIPFKVDDAAKARSGHGVSLWARGTYRYRLSEHWGVFSFASMNRRDYENSDFNDMTLRAGVGPSWAGSTYTVNLTPLLAWRTHGNHLYSRSQGVRLHANQQLSDHWIADLSGEWIKTRNARSPILDEKGPLTDAYLYYQPNSTTTLRAGAHWQRLSSNLSHYSYTMKGASLAAFKDWSYGISTGVSYAYQYLAYDGTQPFFDQRRDDRIQIASLSLGKRDWAIKGFMPVVSVTHIRNRSSIDFFSYRRTLFEVRFDRYF